ncbi:MAG: hypothetical protein ACRC7B_03140 [Metamycoplasmataceae bacterium]
MGNNEIINKWRNALVDDKNATKQLAKIKELTDDDPFFTKLLFDSKKIVSRIGIGYGKLNKLVVELIAYSFANILKENKESDSVIDVIVCSDGSQEIETFLNNIADVLTYEDLTVTAFKRFTGYDKKFVRRTINKLELSAGIFIERSIYNNEVFNIHFIDSSGNDFNDDLIKIIEEEINKNDIFSIKSKPAKIDFLSNNKLINDYIQKILSLSSRKGDQRKVKVTISNYNEGVTEILKKILGNMDFNYKINTNINKGNINIKKNRNDGSFINFYWRDIRFARRNKCDMLICPSRNGSALNLFIFNGRQVFHLDANEITLMFLNFFFIGVNIDTKKIPNSYIGTDLPPIQNIRNLINKYNLELAISEDVRIVDERYLLFYWNQNSQFIFGENYSTEFGFHHLIIRFLEMINYYKTQRLNLGSQRNVLTKMYGSYKTHIIILNNSLSQLYLFLDNIDKSELASKYPIENVVRYDDLNILSENLVAKVIFMSGEELLIKYNYINKKIVIFVRLENDNIKLWNINHFTKNAFVKNITKLIKKSLHLNL